MLLNENVDMKITFGMDVHMRGKNSLKNIYY